MATQHLGDQLLGRLAPFGCAASDLEGEVLVEVKGCGSGFMATVRQVGAR